MVREPTSKSEKTKEVAKSVWSFLRTTSLAVSDGIIALSLMQKGTRPKPGARTAWPKGLRELLRREQGVLCVYCRGKLPFQASHIDHITPVNQGGSNERENLQLLCPGCNLRKSDRNDGEFRYRYRKLLPQERGRMPDRRIRQGDFRAVTRATRDADSYTRFKGGKYLTAAQKVNSGAIVTGGAMALAVFVPINQAVNPEDASALLLTSLAIGIALGAGVRLRAHHTGKDQED